jgi:hypothetical protein
MVAVILGWTKEIGYSVVDELKLDFVYGFEQQTL